MTATINHTDDLAIEEEALRLWTETYTDEPPEFFRATVWHFYVAEARRNLGVTA